MPDTDKDIKAAVESLGNAVKQVVAFYAQKPDGQRMVYPLWNVKDVLGHLTYWHESFARNVSDLAQGRTPHPLKGTLAEVNRQSVETTRDASIEQLCHRLKEAQQTIEAYLTENGPDRIPYKQGSRDYTRMEHLEITTHHLLKHLKDLYHAGGNHPLR